MTRAEAVRFLRTQPYKFGRAVGFTKLTALNNAWIRSMVLSKEDKTLQAHRIAYKTTCVSIAIALLMILRPNLRILFLRKTATDVQEIVAQVKKILLHPVTQAFVRAIYGMDLVLMTDNAYSLTTNLTTDPRGSAQLTAFGCESSITGKHYDLIFTDDIVGPKDRFSRAERERTKWVYQELQNVRNDGGRIFNTGTPWHKEDAFTLMPPPEKWDCYSTDLLSAEKIAQLRAGMTPSLFAANYELRHVAEEGQLFTAAPVFFREPARLYGGFCHIDAAYGGDNATAMTIGSHDSSGMFFFGKRWQRHVDQCLPEIFKYAEAYHCQYIFCELNADKGYLVKAIRAAGYEAYGYQESTNKKYKISTYLAQWWPKIVWLDLTDPDYLSEIMDYTEFAEADDCPDSAASLVRRLIDGR